jgi:hypothetical protein
MRDFSEYAFAGPEGFRLRKQNADVTPPHQQLKLKEERKPPQMYRHVHRNQKRDDAARGVLEDTCDPGSFEDGGVYNDEFQHQSGFFLVPSNGDTTEIPKSTATPSHI